MTDTKEFKKFTLEEIKSIIDDKKKLDAVKIDTNVKIQHSEPATPLQLKSQYIDNIKEMVYTKLNITMESGKPDIDAIRKSSNSSMEIKDGEYMNCYVISDIHADFRKFMMMLMRANIIVLYDPTTDHIQSDGEIDRHLNRIVHDHMYIYELVSTYDIKFKGQSTNLIILGDLVDGKREYTARQITFGEIYDKLGLFELLIHIILYNLRLSGSSSHSTVTITLGNHEMMTLFNNSYHSGHHYIDEATINTFTNYSMRSSILIPFYLFNPYIFQIITKPFGIRAILSHGSFSGENQNFSNITYDNLLRYSNGIRKILFDSFINEEKIIRTRHTQTNLNTLNEFDFINQIIWSRYFPNMFENGTTGLEARSSLVESGCSQIAAIPNIDFFIMGHCQTGAYINNRLNNIQYDNNEYNYCTGNKDCVFVGCLHPNEYGIIFPKLIIVDNAISYANSVLFNDHQSDDEQSDDERSDDERSDDEQSDDERSDGGEDVDVYHSTVLKSESPRIYETNHARYIDAPGAFEPYNVYTYTDKQFTTMTVQFAEILLLRFDKNVAEDTNPYEFYRIRTSFDNNTTPLLYYLINLNTPSIFPKTVPVRNPLIDQSPPGHNPLNGNPLNGNPLNGNPLLASNPSFGQSSPGHNLSFGNPSFGQSLTLSARYYDKYIVNKNNYSSISNHLYERE